MIELRAGDARAVIDPERGGRLASITTGGRELLVGPPDDTDRSIHWGCFLMAPWPGRLADGRLRWRDRTIHLRRSHGRHAIHGLVWGVPWRVARGSTTTAELVVDLDRAGWPFGGEVRQSFSLRPDRLSIEATIVAGDVPMPAALGWHPWFRRDALGPAPTLRLDAAGVLERRRMLPTGAVLPVAGRTDLRTGPALGRRRLDDAYVGVRSPAVLAGRALQLRLEFQSPLETVVVYTPSNAVCIEPQTARPNALGLEGEAARQAGRGDLEPHEAMRARMAIAWSERHSGGDERSTDKLARS